MISIIRRRLFWRVYLAMLSGLVTVAVLMGALWWLMGESMRAHWHPDRISLPDRAWLDAHASQSNGMIERLDGELGPDVSVYAPNGRLLAARGTPIALDEVDRRPAAGRLHILRVDFSDGYALLMRLPPPPVPRRHILTTVIFVAAGVGLAAFPLTARLTRRLEGLRSGVARWGSGALSARVDETGDDEVALVAATFNAAAERVEKLLGSHKALLANASHELRAPLARLRMAIELWIDRPSAANHAEMVQDLAEIDALVEEILLASRLDHAGLLAIRSESVDLLGLAAEEGARIGANVDGSPVEITADASLLRRLIRNLLENAARHGKPPIEIEVREEGFGARIVVCDRGAGIAQAERERVFEPFYRPAGRSESTGGWGLGLSLVRQIATCHGGTVTCEEGVDGGSRFVVRLARDIGARSKPAASCAETSTV